MKKPRNQVASVVASRSLGQATNRRLTREIAAYLLDERRTGELDSIMRDVQETWAANGYVEVVAVSAHPLVSSVKAEIKAKVRKIYPHAKRIVITEEFDPNVIGGVRLELANQQLDLTVSAKINKFKQLTAGE